jgi:hypothetical protein
MVSAGGDSKSNPGEGIIEVVVPRLRGELLLHELEDVALSGS